MACRTPDVERVADKHVKAQEQIDKLEVSLKSKNEEYKKEFFEEIDQNLADAKITDGKQLDYNNQIKVEYTSEFSLDKIAKVVIAAVNAAVAANNPASPTPGMDKEAVEAYTAVVNTVAEAAKSKSTSAASYSFTMTRLCPGMYSFLMAKSTSILDDETFGTEAVSATVVYYRVMQSIDDIKNEAKWGLAVIDAKNLLDMKVIQVALTQRLASGEIDLDTWVDLDSKYEGIIQMLKDRLAEHGWEAPLEDHEAFINLDKHIGETKTAINTLKGMSVRHQRVAKHIERRLSSSNFLQLN